MIILVLDQKLLGLTVKFIRKYLPFININGKDPRAITAAAIYKTCTIYGLPLSQKKVAEIAEVSDVTLRNRIKEFNAALFRVKS